MPLFRISVLALLLLPLPLSLSCDHIRPPADVRSDYSPVVETELNNTKRRITTLLHNTSCNETRLKHKVPKYKSNSTDILLTLHNLTCKMKNLGAPHTDELTGSILNSIRCHCFPRPTKEPTRRTTMRRRRNEQSPSNKETRKLCRVMAILSKITKCYQILNTQFAAN